MSQYQNKLRTLVGASLVAAGLVSGSAFAAVTIDEDGNAFVGKGDVQLAFGWNNDALQQNASNLRFRLTSGGTATWECEGYNAANLYKRTTKSASSQLMDVSVSYDARTNKKGQITGFILTLPGSDSGIEDLEIGNCPKANGWVVQPTLVPDSIKYEGSEEPTLQVTEDGENWVNLPLSF